MIDIKCDLKLFGRLKNARPEDVDYLVNIITDFGRGRTGLDSDIKELLVYAKNNPVTNRYNDNSLKLIIRELQKYAGNSAVNIFRSIFDKPLIAYEDIVDDVYSKLNGGVVKTKTSKQKEKEIALALFGANWRNTTVDERFKISTSMKVLSGTFKISDYINIDLSGNIKHIFAYSMLAVAPVVGGGGLIINSLLGEAYRISIPFVAQMGWIGLQQEAEANHKKNITQKLSANNDIAELCKKEIILHDEQGGQLLKISSFNNGLSKRQPVQPEQISTLNSLLSVIPGVAVLAEQQSGNYILCNLPLESLNKIKGSEAFRGYVTNNTGQFAGHAHLTKPEVLQNIMVSGAAWNALSIVVAQKHLQDINEKLNEIISKLDDIKKELDAEKEDELNGLQRYVQGLLDHYQDELFNESVQNALESHLAKVYKLESHFLRKIEIDLNSIKKIEHDTLMSKEKAREEILLGVETINKRVQSYCKVKQLRVVVCALLYKTNKIERYSSEALNALKELKQLKPIMQEAQQYSCSKIELSNSLTSSVSKKHKDRLIESVAMLNSSYTKGRKDTGRLYDVLFKKIDYSFELKIENGEVTEGALVYVDS